MLNKKNNTKARKVILYFFISDKVYTMSKSDDENELEKLCWDIATMEPFDEFQKSTFS